MLRDTIAMDLPRSCLMPKVEGGPSPFFFILPLQSVFDTRTRLFYKFPEFHIALVCREEPNIADIP